MNTQVKNEQMLQKQTEMRSYSFNPATLLGPCSYFLEDKEDFLKWELSNLSLSMNTPSVHIEEMNEWCLCAPEIAPWLWEMLLYELTVGEKEEWYFVSWKNLGNITEIKGIQGSSLGEHSWGVRGRC